VNGILFNHESPRRGKDFVTRKITIGIGKILRGDEDCLRLGNLDSLRDWGHARDYVKGMWMMLQADSPDDFVLATGEQHSVREFVELCFQHVGIRIGWRGEGVEEVGYNKESGRVYVKVNAEHLRPSEVDDLLGDAYKARHVLGWQPETSFQELVAEMMEEDVRRV
jgi:GDPmannose 4,6-dehydratase